MKKIGLIVGKFAPLHKGHEFLIKRALEEMERVIVFVYDSPDTPYLPVVLRAKWIRRQFPRVLVIEGRNGPKERGFSEKNMEAHERYVKKHVKEKVTHVYSGEWYGKRLARAFHAQNRIIDKERTHVPISGSKLRKNPRKYRVFIDRAIFEEFIAARGNISQK